MNTVHYANEIALLQNIFLYLPHVLRGIARIRGITSHLGRSWALKAYGLPRSRGACYVKEMYAGQQLPLDELHAITNSRTIWVGGLECRPKCDGVW